MYLSPSQIRYTQHDISAMFGSGRYRGERVGFTLDALCEGHIKVGDLPPIRITQRPGTQTWYSLDNRRLWLFRCMEALGKCDKIYVRIVAHTEEFDKKLCKKNDGKDISFRGGCTPGGTWYKNIISDRSRYEKKRSRSGSFSPARSKAIQKRSRYDSPSPDRSKGRRKQSNEYFSRSPSPTLEQGANVSRKSRTEHVSRGEKLRTEMLDRLTRIQLGYPLPIVAFNRRRSQRLIQKHLRGSIQTCYRH